MPNKDGSGPLGQGSKTGRGLGNCNSNSTNDETVIGRFRRWCRGGGNGGGRNRNGNGRGQGRSFGNGNQQNNNIQK